MLLYLSGYYGGYRMFSSAGSMTYLLLVIPALILSLVAQARIKSVYAKMSAVQNSRHITGMQAAEMILRYYNVSGVRIEACTGTLSDHYDPKTNVIRLSSEVYSSSSVAAVGIACHEAGHAVQHAENYDPIRWRNAILPVCRIGSYIGLPLAFIGYFLGFGILVYVGLLLYSAIMIFQLVTLPVEFNASRRALNVIKDSGLLPVEEEYEGARKVLRCAAMTYVASFAVTIANLLRYVVILTGRRRK